MQALVWTGGGPPGTAGRGGGGGTSVRVQRPGGVVPLPQAPVNLVKRLCPELGAAAVPLSARVRPHWSATTWAPFCDWKLTSQVSAPTKTFPWTMLFTVFARGWQVNSTCELVPLTMLFRKLGLSTKSVRASP